MSPKQPDNPDLRSTEVYEPPPEELATTVGAASTEADTATPGSEPNPAKTTALGSVIAGKYTLVERIGQGGMGAVYLARQSEPVKRDVALKLIKIGADSDSVVARFEAERQALALMDHPHIARVYDGGTTVDHVPFFVMELVRGVPITQYCDEKLLTIEARLGLFVSLCQAVQHAHLKGVIHRDLKPGNVLVTEVDGEPVPKVIDFGVAKAIDRKLFDANVADTGQIVGTPAYMSPEQLNPKLADIDTRTDVHALGVILYELLTGSLPFETTRFQEGGFLEWCRLVREEDPPRPSTRVAADNTVADLAARRNTQPNQFARLLKGELDWVVMKALEKDRSRRYESAGGFAADVSRYLSGDSVLAHPQSAGYRLRKLLRKYKGTVAATCLVFITLTAGVIGTSYGLVRAERQRRVAVANHQTAEENYQLARKAVDRYLTQIGENRLLNEPYMDELRHELLSLAREFYTEFAERRQNDPDARTDLAQAHRRLGEIAWRLGDHEEAIDELKAGRNVLSAGHGQATPEFLEMGARLAEYMMELGRYGDALRLTESTLKDARSALDASPTDASTSHLIARTFARRGAILRKQNKTPEAVKAFEQAADILLGLAKSFPREWSYSSDLAGVYTHRGQIAYRDRDDDSAEEWHRKAMSIRRRRVAAESDSERAKSELALSLNQLAGVLRRKRKCDEGIPLNEESVRIYRALVAAHPALAGYRSDLAAALTNLSVLFQTSGNQDRADALNDEAVALLADVARRFPAVTQYTYALGAVEGNLGNGFLSRKQHETAIGWYDRSINTLQPLLKNSDDPRIRGVLRNSNWGKADALVASGRFAEAIYAFDGAIAVADDRTRPELRMARALALAKSGDHRAASAAVVAETAGEKVDGFIWYDAARVLMAAAEAVPKDSAVSKGARQGLIDDLHARAVAALRQAASKNYFTDSKTRLNESAEFKALREHPGFNSVLKRVMKGTDQ